MTNDVTVSAERGEDAGRYVVNIDGYEGEMVYTVLASDLISIDHTFVPPELRGKNVAGALLNYALEDARTKHWKIIPRCSYVAAQAKRHPEWSDVIISPESA